MIFAVRDTEVSTVACEEAKARGYDFRFGKKNSGDVSLLKTLCDLVSKGGNFLLNIGPDYLGRIPAPSIDILKAAK